MATTQVTATFEVYVYDTDGNAIEGATVKVDGQSVTTDSDGAATFSLETGDYTIMFSLAGYDTEIVAVTLAAPVTIQAAELSLLACPNVLDGTATTASVSPDELGIAKGDSEDVVITATDDNGCPAAGVKVKKKVSLANNKKINVSPPSATTDASGQVAFTIKAKKNKGYATVKFKVDGVKVKPKVKVALTK